MQQLFHRLHIHGRFTVLRHSLRLVATIAERGFLLHVDRHAQIGAPFPLWVQAGEAAAQLMLQGQVVFVSIAAQSNGLTMVSSSMPLLLPS